MRKFLLFASLAGLLLTAIPVRTHAIAPQNSSEQQNEKATQKVTGKVTSIEPREDAFEIINLAVSRGDYFAPALPSRDVRGAENLRAENVRAINAFLIARRFS